jgi:hypothetical protein
MNLIERVTSPTPTFFQKLRNIGLALAAISAAIIASPVTLPTILNLMTVTIVFQI